MPEAASSAATAAGRGAGAKRRAAGAGGSRTSRKAKATFPATFRWARISLLVSAVVVGLPLAHAMFGEVVALLGGGVALGFLLGRWTAPG